MDITKAEGWLTGRSTSSVNASGGDEEARRMQTRWLRSTAMSGRGRKSSAVVKT